MAMSTWSASIGIALGDGKPGAAELVRDADARPHPHPSRAGLTANENSYAPNQTSPPAKPRGVLQEILSYFALSNTWPVFLIVPTIIITDLFFQVCSRAYFAHTIYDYRPAPNFFIILGVVVILLLTWVAITWKQSKFLATIALSVTLGGIFADFIVNAYVGPVADYLPVPIWLTGEYGTECNVADVCMVAGLLILLSACCLPSPRRVARVAEETF